MAEHAPEQVVGGLGDLAERLHGGEAGVEALVLLGVVAQLGAVAEADLALVGGVDPGQDAQQRGLAGPVEAQHQQPLAPLEVKGDVLEHRRAAGGARQVDRVQREAARRRRVGEADGHLAAGAALGRQRSFIFSTRRSVTMARRAMSSLEWRYFSTNADSRLMSRSRTLRCLASDLARTSLASRYWVQVPL